MNTIWHIFWTWAIFRKKKYAIKPILFAFIPDLPWLLGLIYSLIISGLNWNGFIGGYYYLPIIYATFFLHSFFIVTLFYALTLLKKKKKYYPYFYGWYLHIFLDYGTHVSDAYPIFWPLSNFYIPSIVSYWERSHHSFELAIINLILVSMFVFYLIYKKEIFSKIDLIVSTSSLILLFVSLVFFFIISRNKLYVLLNLIPIILNTLLIIKILKQRKKLKNEK